MRLGVGYAEKTSRLNSMLTLDKKSQFFLLVVTHYVVIQPKNGHAKCSYSSRLFFSSQYTGHGTSLERCLLSVSAADLSKMLTILL